MSFITNRAAFLKLSVIILYMLCATVFGKTIYVDDDASGANDGSSWADAYNCLQDALADANSAVKPVEIRVAQGVYKPDQGAAQTQADSRAAFDLINGVTIKGGFAGSGQTDPNAIDTALYETILSGDLDGNDIDVENPAGLPGEPSRSENSYHIVTASGTDDTAILEGFTITAGNAYVPGSFSDGGGLYIDCAGPKVIGCTFRLNSASGNGAAAYVCERSKPAPPRRGELLISDVAGQSESSPSFLNCTFDRNAGDGAVYCEGTTLAIEQCVFSANTAGAVKCYSERMLIARCSFTGNSGGAVDSEVDLDFQIENCTFHRNSTPGSGGAIHNGSRGRGKVTNCRFSGNTADGFGGAVYSEKSMSLVGCLFSGNEAGMDGGAVRGVGTLLVNCTIVRNSAREYTGGVSGSCTLVNSIVWGNTDGRSDSVFNAQLSFQQTIQPRATFCCIQDNHPTDGIVSSNLNYLSENNIDADPLFVDADGPDNMIGTKDDNFRLLFGSPCINAGTNDTPEQLPDSDIDNNNRIAGSIVDIGAYEGGNQGFMLSGRAIVVAEGDTDTFTVALAADPCETVEAVVEKASGNPRIEIVAGQTLIFDSSNYNQPQAVRVYADRANAYPDPAALLRVSAPGLPSAGVTVTEAHVLLVDSNATGQNDGSSWENALNYLQDALADANSLPKPVEIHVAQGIYRADEGADQELYDPNETFELINQVALRGGYAGLSAADPNLRNHTKFKTILNGDLRVDDRLTIPSGPTGTGVRFNADNSYCIVTAEGTDASAILDGFVVTAAQSKAMSCLSGDATVENCIFTRNRGNAMYIENCLRGPKIFNCIFADNSSSSPGWNGGALHNFFSSPVIIDSTFTRNSAWQGAAISNMGEISLINCVLSQNQATGDMMSGGGAICNFMNAGATSLVGCSIRQNYAYKGAGLYSESRASQVLTDCDIQGNSATEGGVIYAMNNSVIELFNCSICNNTAEDGAVSGGFGPVALTNCTAVDNLSRGEPWFNSPVDLTNCILWAESAGADQILPTGQAQGRDKNPSGNIATVNYSCLPGSWPGEGNINADPMLTRDFHLQAGSPCIDAGDPNYAGKHSDKDVDNERRIWAGRVDMGRDEFVDGDRDGLPDFWEEKYFGSVTQASPNLNDDGDEWDNIAEYIRGSNPVHAPTVYYVNPASGDDEYDGLAPLWDDIHGPMATVQAAVDAAEAFDNDKVVLAPGRYTGEGNRDIDYRGKAITIQSINPDDPGTVAETVIDCQGSLSEPHRGFIFNSGESYDSVLAGVTVTNGRQSVGGAVYSGAFGTRQSNPAVRRCRLIKNYADSGGAIGCGGGQPEISGCEFVGNFAAQQGGAVYINRGNLDISHCSLRANSALYGAAALSCSYGVYSVTNCTFTGNKARAGSISALGSKIMIRNCILWANSSPDDTEITLASYLYPLRPGLLELSYSNIQGGQPSIQADSNCTISYEPGNIRQDPLFADPGYWDPNGTPDNPNDDFWVDGDYHLKSQAGRWNPDSESRLQDDVTSPCIDTGDPGSLIGNEPPPNGGIINMGFYGGTAEASMSL